MKKRWIQKATDKSKKGNLHRQLGLNPSETIPKKTLRDIIATPIGKHSHGHEVTRLLKQRALFAINAQSRRNKGR